MDILLSAFLGFVQGATEFLPISSSGHLILTREVFGISAEGSLAYDAVLQLATALAVLIYFWKDFVALTKGFFRLITQKKVEQKTKILIYAIVVATIPAAIFGLLLQDYMETTFRTAEFVVVTLLLGALLFYIAEKVAKQNREVTVKSGLGIGFFQALALFPGTSRSGATIAGGLVFGLTRQEAARFSFLLAFPIIAGSGLVKLFGIVGERPEYNLELFIGAIASFVVGIAAIHFLIKYLKNHTLSIFIWYRIILAVVVLITLV